MKKSAFIIITIFIVFFCNTALAENDIIAYTQNTDIKCTIDGLYIESYAINGFMYLPIDKLTDYGFDVKNSNDSFVLTRKDIFYFDGDYTENKHVISNLPVYKNPTPVIINGVIANTYLVNDKIVIQADELLTFGKVEWDEVSKEVKIYIIVDELCNAYENIQDKVEYTKDEPYIVGQVKDGIPCGLVKTGYFQGMTYIGHMIDGEYEGVVYGYRQHKPYLAALSEIKTVKKGKKNGYCRYVVGYNNKPQMRGEIKSVEGMYVNDELKNGTYTIVIDDYGNTATYIVSDYKEHILSSTHEYYGYEKSPSLIFCNGEEIKFDVQPVLESDRTLIPLRGLFEKMGAMVEWNNNDQTVTVTKNDTTLSFQINHYDARINDDVKYMDVPARLIDNRTMIPLRFLSEELKYEVNWDVTTGIITITE